MIQTLNEAKEYAIDRVQKVSGEVISDTEKVIIETILEDDFYSKISDSISENELESIQSASEADFEGKLFYKVPNYISLLEETTANFLAEYLS